MANKNPWILTKYRQTPVKCVVKDDSEVRFLIFVYLMPLSILEDAKNVKRNFRNFQSAAASVHKKIYSISIRAQAVMISRPGRKFNK